jgi:Holliday junction resolvase
VLSATIGLGIGKMKDEKNHFKTGSVARSEIDNFLSVATEWRDAAQHAIISYVGIMIDGTYWLQRATVRVCCGPVEEKFREPSRVVISDFLIGRLTLDLTLEPLDLEALTTNLSINSKEQALRLRGGEETQLNAKFFTEKHPNLRFGEARSPALVLSVDQPPNNISSHLILSLEQRLRSCEKPYDGIADLLDEHLVPLDSLSQQNCTIEIVLENPAETALAHSTIKSGHLTAKIMASSRISPHRLRIGIKYLNPPHRPERQSILGDTLSWSQENGLATATLSYPLGEASVCQIFLSYGGQYISHWWIGDPTRMPNQRASFLEQFDKDLLKLRGELISTDSKGHSFERVLTLALEEIGFNCMYLGDISQFQEAPDIFCETPSGRVALIECAAVVTNTSEKLSKLHQRVLRIKQQFALQRLAHVQIIGVLVTKHDAAEIEPFIEEASRFGFNILGLPALARLADGLRFAVKPEQIYDQVLSFSGAETVQLTSPMITTNLLP